MQNILTVDLSGLIDGGTSSWLSGGPGSQEDCAVRLVRIAPNTSTEDYRSCAVDRFYFLLAGAMVADIGTDRFETEAQTLVFLPAGTSHREQNLSQKDVVYLEIFAPSPPSNFFVTTVPKKILDAASFIRLVKAEAFSADGFASTTLAQRSTGSNHIRINRVKVTAGAGGPDFHIHAFDQFYFILSGTMTVEIGKKRFSVPANSLVRLPAGVVHRNYNAGRETEHHVALLVPEPAEGEIFDYAVEIHEYEAERISVIPVE